MFSEKTVKVGNGEKYLTFSEVFKRYKRGKLHIILTSDVYDGKDIIVPKSISSLRVTSQGDVQRCFINKWIIIHCNGVKVCLENIGEKDSNLIVIGNERNVAHMHMTLRKCYLEYLIGAYNVKKVNDFTMVIENSEIRVVSGFLNHELPILCRNMEMNITETKMDILCAIDFASKVENSKVHLQAGTVRLKNSVVKEVNLANRKTTNGEEKLPLKLLITQDSKILNGIR